MLKERCKRRGQESDLKYPRECPTPVAPAEYKMYSI